MSLKQQTAVLCIQVCFYFYFDVIHYVICALSSSSFSMHNLKNHQIIPCKREGKQTFFCKQT